MKIRTLSEKEISTVSGGSDITVQGGSNSIYRPPQRAPLPDDGRSYYEVAGLTNLTYEQYVEWYEYY